MGLDEANLDLTEYCEQNEIISDEQKHGLAWEIRTKIKEAT